MNQSIENLKNRLIAAEGDKRKMEAAIDRVSSFLAGSILGRDFGESVDDFLNRRPDLKEVHEWAAKVTLSKDYKIVSI